MKHEIDLVAILDASGSMMGYAAKTVSSFNEFIASQCSKVNSEVDMFVTLVLFDDKYRTVYERVPLQRVEELTVGEYMHGMGGTTALHDAVGSTINKLMHTKNAIFFIDTDGWENASKEYNLVNIQSLIKTKRLDGWDFVFMGADMTSAQTEKTAMDFNINPNNQFAFEKNDSGYKMRSLNMSTVTASYTSQITNNK